MAVNFKLDPSSLPKLDSRGSNYTEWKSAWSIALKYAGLWSIVSGQHHRSEAQADDWEEKDNKAMIMLISSVHSDLTLNLTTCEQSAKAWKYLAGRFDRDTGNTSIQLFRTLTGLRLRDGDDLRTHLDLFHQTWTRMQKRCISSSQAVAKSMLPIFESDDVKGSFFLTTLPESMDTIIDNLNTRDITSFAAIEPKMLDISEKHSLDQIDSTSAYAARGRPKPKMASNSATPFNSTTSNKECTWCQKRNFSFVGHTYRDCYRLQNHRNKSSPAPKKDKRQKASTANEAVVHGDDSETNVHAFCATVINCHDKRSQEVHPTGFTVSESKPNSQWLFDSGASKHMTGQIDDFVSLSPRKGIITIAGGVRIPVEGQGTVRLKARLPNGSTRTIELTEVLFSTELRDTRLFSWPYVRNKGCTTYAKGDHIYVQSPASKTVLWAKFKNGVMALQLDDENTPSAFSNFASYTEFHHAIGHFSVPNPTQLFKDSDMVPRRPPNFYCEDCQMSKSTHHQPGSTIGLTAKRPFELIHSDLSGKFSRQSLGGHWYYLSLIDDATRFAWVRFIHKKSDTKAVVQNFLRYVERQFDAKVKRFRSDNGGEYNSGELQSIFKQNGIVHETSPPYFHEANGTAERFNRTITTAARAMIRDDQSLHLWAEAVHTAVFLKNIAPHSRLLSTPFEALYGDKPSIKHLHPFGTQAFVHIPKEARAPGSKLLHRAESGTFVGYGKTSKIFRIYIPDRNAVVESRDVTFAPFNEPDQKSQTEFNFDLKTRQPETQLPAEPTQSTQKPSTPTRLTPRAEPQSSPAAPLSPPQMAGSWEDVDTPAQPSSEIAPAATPGTSVTTRVGRTVKPSDKARQSQMTHGMTAIESELEDGDPISAFAFAALHFDDDIPSTIAQAKKSPSWPQWKEAIHAELASHESNGTWFEVDDDGKRHTVGSRWVFAIKRNEHDEIVRYKARLVAQGFSQVPGIDFDETYAPVVRYDSLRILLCLSVQNTKIQIHQMDFDTAYLNGSLQETIYMRCPPGFQNPGKVLKLAKTLYGLRQSGREWFSTLREWLTQKKLRAIRL